MKTPTAIFFLSGALACSGQWYFEAGPTGRGGMEISVRGGSRAAESGAMAARPGTNGARVDPADSLLDDDGAAPTLRLFDDGYVGPSGWPWAQDLGTTQYWGYESDAQYDANADRLNYRLTLEAEGSTMRTVTSVESSPSGWSGQRRVEGEGAQMTLGRLMHDGEVWDWSAQIQLGWLDGIGARFNGREAFRQDVEWTRRRSSHTQQEVWGYSYDTLGNPALPSAPYEMLDPSGVGPLIADTPETITRLSADTSVADRAVSRRSAVARSQVDLEADADALVLQLGPRFRWHPTSGLSVLVQTGLTLNYLDADIVRQETFAWDGGEVLAQWTDRRDKQCWLWGAGVAAGAQWILTESLYLHGAFGYEWVESVQFDAGPDRVRVDLSGYRAELALGWRFGFGVGGGPQ